MAIKVYLSPSNQDENLYAWGNTTEMEQCNRIAEYARIALERCGFEVKKALKGLAMDVSIAESNKWGADLHLPIHTNAGGGAGTVVFVYNNADCNTKIAKPIYKAVQDFSIGTVDYGVRADPRLKELNSTLATAVYVEVDFHDNPDIAKWIVNNVWGIGEAICRGICEAYNVIYVPVDTPVNSRTIYRVQVGAFFKEENAKALRDKLKADGYTTAFITKTEKE